MSRHLLGAALATQEFAARRARVYDAIGRDGLALMQGLPYSPTEGSSESPDGAPGLLQRYPK